MSTRGLRGSGPALGMPTLALRIGDRSPDELAAALAARGVIASGGHQCAPLAHQTLGTAPDGVLRISFGATSVDEDVARASEALHAIAGTTS